MQGAASPTGSAGSAVGIVERRLVPPLLGGGLPVRIVEDAVHRARVEALAAARAELRDDDHVDAVVEDGAELGRAVADARVAVDADRHVDVERHVLPLGVPLAIGEALLACPSGHTLKIAV